LKLWAATGGANVRQISRETTDRETARRDSAPMRRSVRNPTVDRRAALSLSCRGCRYIPVSSGDQARPDGYNARMRPLVPSLCCFLLLALLSPPAHAQETPTEREAARDVLAKMGTLEQSLKVSSLVATLTAPNAAREKVVARAKALMTG